MKRVERINEWMHVILYDTRLHFWFDIVIDITCYLNEEESLFKRIKGKLLRATDARGKVSIVHNPDKITIHSVMKLQGRGQKHE